MYRFRYLIISGFFFLSLFSACKIDRQLNPLSQQMKNWASFKEGSYWIFENDSTGTHDSLFVGFNGTDVYPSADNTYDVETVNTTITDTSDVLLGFIFGVGFKEIVFQDFGIDPEYEVAAGFNLSDDVVVEETITFGNFVCTIQYTDSLIIPDTSYEDVLWLEAHPMDSEGNIIHSTYYQYWIARNHWIIKKIYTNHQQIYSWSLLRSNIIQ